MSIIYWPNQWNWGKSWVFYQFGYTWSITWSPATSPSPLSILPSVHILQHLSPPLPRSWPTKSVSFNPRLLTCGPQTRNHLRMGNCFISPPKAGHVNPVCPWRQQTAWSTHTRRHPSCQPHAGPRPGSSLWGSLPLPVPPWTGSSDPVGITVVRFSLPTSFQFQKSTLGPKVFLTPKCSWPQSILDPKVLLALLWVCLFFSLLTWLTHPTPAPAGTLPCPSTPCTAT